MRDASSDVRHTRASRSAKVHILTEIDDEKSDNIVVWNRRKCRARLP